MSKFTWKEEDFEPIKVPTLSEFKGSVRNKMGTWDKMQKWFIRSYGVEKAKIIYPILFLRKEEEDKLKKMVIEWAKKMNPKANKDYIDSISGMYDLKYAPCYFYTNPKWSKKGYAYVHKKQLIGKTDEIILS